MVYAWEIEKAMIDSTISQDELATLTKITDEFGRSVFRRFRVLKKASSDSYTYVSLKNFNPNKYYDSYINDYDEEGREIRYQRICKDSVPHVYYYWWFACGKIKAYKKCNLEENLETFYEYNEQGDCVHFKGKNWSKGPTDELAPNEDVFYEYTYYPNGNLKSCKTWDAGSTDYFYYEYRDMDYIFEEDMDYIFEEDALSYSFDSKTGEEKRYEKEKKKKTYAENVQLDLFGYPICWD